MSKQPILAPLDFSDLHTYSVHDRHSKVAVDDFARPVRPGMKVSELIDNLPNQFAGVDFPEFIDRVISSINKKRPVLLGMGAYVIKVGLNPILIDLMERGRDYPRYGNRYGRSDLRGCRLCARSRSLRCGTGGRGRGRGSAQSSH